MTEQITITVPDGTREKLRTVGNLPAMGQKMSPEQLVTELTLIASCIPQNAGPRIFREKINGLLKRMGFGPVTLGTIYEHAKG